MSKAKRTNVLTDAVLDACDFMRDFDEHVAQEDEPAFMHERKGKTVQKRDLYTAEKQIEGV